MKNPMQVKKFEAQKHLQAHVFDMGLRQNDVLFTDQILRSAIRLPI
jgi:hypothetical protein